MKKKERIVALCCTYYQLIVVLHIKNNLLKESSLTILLSDDSNNSSRVVENLLRENVFDNIYLVKKTRSTKDQFYYLHRSSQLRKCIFGDKEFSFLSQEKYDRFMFFNWDMYTYWIYAELTKNNKSITASIFEEGFISYDRVYDYPQLDKKSQYMLVRMIRRFLGKPNLLDSVTEFYCFNPALYKGQFVTVRIPVINTEDLKFIALLTRVFDLKKDTCKYPERFIYFSSLIDTEGDGSENGEVDLALAISKIVGRDNLLVKVHPRDDVKKYEKAGLKIDINSSVPFEILQLVYDFSNHIFITTMSGAVLTINAIVSQQSKVYYIYDLYKKRSPYMIEWSAKYTRLLETLKQFSIIKDCKSIKTIEEMTNELENCMNDL